MKLISPFVFTTQMVQSLYFLNPKFQASIDRRTWSETPKTGFLRTRLIYFQLTEFIWVQCDHPNCQKWRRIPTANGDDLGDEPWYCSMNPDPNMNSCGATEEDHRRYDRMAKKAGVKFVMSMLNVGTLVWARTPGYCR